MVQRFARRRRSTQAGKSSPSSSDEKKRFLREAIARVAVGHVLTTVDVFVLAIKAGRLTIEQADADKGALEGRRFKVAFGSYRELVK